MGLAVLQSWAVRAQDSSDESVAGASEGAAAGDTVSKREAVVIGPSEQQEPPTEEIMVRGIRGSLQRSMDVKRHASAIVDAIAAQDLGKFPDQNVAESLQRIAGVSIDRNGGEGRSITVRGLGPQFNSTLLNGRTVATETFGRQFSFDMLAAELISGAEVYKSPIARLQEGGIGSTINIKTARPLDFRGFNARLRTMGLFDTNSRSITPQVSGLVSNTFLDDKLGVLLSFSHQQRKARVDNIGTANFNANQKLTLVDGRVLEGVFVPQNYTMNMDFQERRRTGGTVALQFQPLDSVRITLDGLYSNFEVRSSITQLGHWFTATQIDDAHVDENNTVIELTHGIKGATDYVNSTSNRPTEIWLAGLNAQWDLSQDLTLSADAAYSRAATNNGGKGRFTVIGFNNLSTYVNRTPGQIPSLFQAPGGLPLDVQDPSLGRAHMASLGGSNTTDDLFEGRLDGLWRMQAEGLQGLRVGAYGYGRVKKSKGFGTSHPDTPSELSGVTCLYCGYATDVPDTLLWPVNATGFFPDVRADIPRRWQSFDHLAYVDYLESPAAIAANKDPMKAAAVIMANDGFTLFEQPGGSRVEEQTYGTYLQFDFGGEFGDMAWEANAGARYVRSRQTAFGMQRELLMLILVDPTLYQAIRGDPTWLWESSSYGNLLPSTNLMIEPFEDVVVRASYARSLTRPTLGQLRPVTSFSINRPGNLRANGGQPHLRPFTADNLDLSIEWYYGRSSYVGVAGYYKKVGNFIVEKVQKETYTLLTGPDTTNVMPANFTYEVRRPSNAESADVGGLEVSLQHVFEHLPHPFDGLGTQATLTFVESNARVQLGNVTETFALEGLGNSQNLVLFYEKGPLQLRTAVNRRSAFLANISGRGGEPVFVEGYTQLDLSGSFQVTQNVAAFFQAINVTDSRGRRHGRYANHFLGLSDAGARYGLGLRGSL
ncbi:MAG: TonB-dependent receptor [Proteobacteria bacterium]|nr:TonB-dependent receptor [Pseudomonadota bacterium]